MDKPGLTAERTIESAIQAAEPISSTILPFKVQDLFFQFAEKLNEVFWVTQVSDGRFLYISPGYERVWGRTCESLYQHPDRFFDSVLPEDRVRVATAVVEQPLRPRTEIEYRILHTSGSVRWIRSRMFPVRGSASDGERVVGISEDITERKVAEKTILEISGRERDRMGQDLHDGVCQQLTGISFMVKVLESDMRKTHPGLADKALEIGHLIKQTIADTRSVARGLYPVELKTHGLTGALQELALHCAQLFGISCTYMGSDSVSVNDNETAMHLFRIAQEAVTNAVTHGKADQVLIHLTEENRVVHLRIRDNGHGFPQVSDRGQGMGIRIMDYRSRMIGGTLTVQPEAEGGALVTCSYPCPPENR